MPKIFYSGSKGNELRNFHAVIKSSCSVHTQYITTKRVGVRYLKQNITQNIMHALDAVIYIQAGIYFVSTYILFECYILYIGTYIVARSGVDFEIEFGIGYPADRK